MNIRANGMDNAMDIYMDIYTGLDTINIWCYDCYEVITHL